MKRRTHTKIIIIIKIKYTRTWHDYKSKFYFVSSVLFTLKEQIMSLEGNVNFLMLISY